MKHKKTICLKTKLNQELKKKNVKTNRQSQYIERVGA